MTQLTSEQDSPLITSGPLIPEGFALVCNGTTKNTPWTSGPPIRPQSVLQYSSLSQNLKGCTLDFQLKWSLNWMCIQIWAMNLKFEMWFTYSIFINQKKPQWRSKDFVDTAEWLLSVSLFPVLLLDRYIVHGYFPSDIFCCKLYSSYPLYLHALISWKCIYCVGVIWL